MKRILDNNNNTNRNQSKRNIKNWIFSTDFLLGSQKGPNKK